MLMNQHNSDINKPRTRENEQQNIATPPSYNNAIARQNQSPQNNMLLNPYDSTYKSVGNFAVESLVEDTNNSETQSTISNHTYMDTTRHFYQPDTNQPILPRKNKRARTTKEKIYDSLEEIEAADLTQDQKKKETRKWKNRIAAQKCREAKEVKILQAESHVKQLENENRQLRALNTEQSRRIEHLEFQVKQHIIKLDGVGKEDFPEIFAKQENNGSGDFQETRTGTVGGINGSNWMNVTPPVTQNWSTSNTFAVPNSVSEQHVYQSGSSSMPIMEFNNSNPTATIAAPIAPRAEPVNLSNIQLEVPKPVGILQRRNSQSKKNKPQHTLSLTDISNHTSSMALNSLPIPRRSPRLARQTASMTPGPRTNDIVSILDSFSSNNNNNFTPNNIKSPFKAGRFNKTPSVPTKNSVEDIKRDFLSDRPLTRSAKRKKEEDSCYFQF